MTVLIVIVLVLFLFALYMYKEANENTVIQQDIALHDLPSSFKEVNIFFISDIHRRNIARSIVDEVKGKVDFVIIGGDIGERGISFSQIASNLKLLSEIGPIYFVWGNNDYELDYHELDALLLANKVTVLDNTRAVLESSAGERLWLIGVDDVGVGRDRLDLALQDCEEEGFRILVSHNPEIVYKFTDKEHISLVLSGHTHGGQIRLFHHNRFLKGGIYQYDYTTLFVSNGYGTTLLPFRFRAPAQTHVITLKHSL
ncbi:metallophosphoesterase [Ectobacillus antri]|jgi:predicted MPP superfamily phosphohydrolase|uniref:Metallophosphoesterase n=1 Tax=Ectobacillus antri TaxID=2486280 RepID=A0ABT6H072_9BACI|nr:metallophosphoesterase [Ectobacillus antri]MDG4656070.1 metallophosphoesterase [Ectobacillus antri]MDG5752745.1 metallophosphoesterase [Ectobacillus antri]